MYRWILSTKCVILKHRVNLSEVVLVRPAKALHGAKVARIQKRLTTTDLCEWTSLANIPVSNIPVYLLKIVV